MSREFVCVVDEAFLLGPPNWLKLKWLPQHDQKSLLLFRKFRQNTPAGVIPNGSTVQGLYFMTADGEYLGGDFANTFRNQAKQLIRTAWTRFDRIAKRNGWKPKPVPRTPLSFTLGKPNSGGLKLEVAVRDLPRGKDKRPGKNELERCAHNLKWIDLTAGEAAAFVTTENTWQPVANSVLNKIAYKTLKDCVRGQCTDWPKGALREGKLQVKAVVNNGSRATISISGFARLATNTRSFVCQLHGRAVFDSRTKKFADFELVASGQRTGRTQFNGRRTDLGPAPLGVAYRMHKSGR